MNINKIPIGDNPPIEVNVVIEVPLRADPIKYEFDKEAGAIMVDRFLYTSMFYPCNYGFVPHTLSDDGDPIDVMVIGRMPVQPGAVLPARVIGMLELEDEGVEEAEAEAEAPAEPAGEAGRLKEAVDGRGILTGVTPDAVVNDDRVALRRPCCSNNRFRWRCIKK